MTKKKEEHSMKENRKVRLDWFEKTPTQTTGTGELSAEMATFWNTALIKLAQPKLVHDQFGKKQSIPKNNGKKIEWRKFSSLPKALTPLVEGVTPDGNKLTVTEVTATVSQYGDYVPYSDVLQMTTKDPIVAEYASALSAQAGLTKDTLTRNELLGGTNVIYAPAVETVDISTNTETEGTGQSTTQTAAKVTFTPSSRAELTTACRLSVKAVMKAAAVLAAQNAPTINGSYVAIIHPYAKYDLIADSGLSWIDVAKYGDHIRDIIEGEIGKIGNVRFVESSEAKIYKKGTDSSAASIFCTLVMGADAFGTVDVEGGGLQMIVKQLGSGDDPLNQRATIGWKLTHAAKRLVEQYMVRIESCSEQFADVPEN